MGGMKQRWVAGAVITASVTVAITCVQDSLVDCGDGVACPAGLQCVSAPELPAPTCANRDQRAACEGRNDKSACTLGGLPGTCFDGACILAVCGDNITDASEACDDGNTVGSDGCSANCASIEKCGDGVIDLLAEEQCEDAVAGLSGDGCSSTCKIEYLFWRDVTPGTIDARFGYGLATGPDGNVVLFGGAVGSGSNTNATYDETWEWDGSTWARLAPPTSPPRRTWPALAYDPRRHRVVMFGGFDTIGTRTDTTWEFDGVTWEERTPTTRPAARAIASLACSPTRCVLAGGNSLGEAETWSWDGDDWSRIPNGPPPREGAALAYDAARDVFLLSNGRTGPGIIDTWELGTSGWTQITNTATLPAIAQPILAAYNPVTRRVYAGASSLFEYTAAGWGSASVSPPSGAGTLAWNEARQRLTATSGSSITSVHQYDGTAWSTTTTSSPAGLSHAAATFDRANGRTILFERTTGMWAWNGTAWRLLASPASGPAVFVTAIAFDETCGDVILFGGATGANALPGETWRFDGTWHQMSIAGPPGRIAHAMAYDPSRRATILLGGRTSLSTQVPAEDMWQLAGPCDGRAWSQISVTPHPPARSNTTLVFDPRSDQLVVFGGQTQTAPLGDTWTWDGAAWTEHVVTPAPSARFEHGLAFDPKRREVVLVGGRASPGSRLGDVWRWNGNEWKETTALVPLTPRAGGALVPDRTDALVLIGGDTASVGSTQSIARLGYDQALHPSERCQIASADEDRDGLAGCADPDCRGRCAPTCPVTIELPSCTGPRCGDGTCSPVEDPGICPADCAP